MNNHGKSNYEKEGKVSSIAGSLGETSFSKEVDYWCQIFPDKSRGEIIRSCLDRNYSEDDAQLISGFSERYRALTGLHLQESYEQSSCIIKYLEGQLDKKSLKNSLRTMSYRDKIIEILNKGNEGLYFKLEKILKHLEKESLVRVTT